MAGLVAGLATMIAVQFAQPFAAVADITLHATLAGTWYVLAGTMVTFSTGWLVSRLAPGAANTGGETQ